jgi:hypothetical protein
VRGSSRKKCSAAAFVKPGFGHSGETGTWCFRSPDTRDFGKATGSIHETGSFRELLDLGSRLGVGRCL